MQHMIDIQITITNSHSSPVTDFNNYLFYEADIQ